MHGLSNGRFTLGIGRGVPPLQDAFGIPRITTAQMEDFVGVMRRLFRGETIVGHDGPIGRFPALRLGQDYDVDLPIGMVAFAPNSLELAGRVMDQVILHTFFTDETLARCVKTVKDSAERAGRNPDNVKVWSCLATIGDHIPEEMRLRKLVGRLATYLQGYGDLLVRTNRWDVQVLQRFRDDELVQSFSKGGLQVIDSPTTSVEQLERIAALLPPEWTAPAATGSAQSCVDTIREQLALGADGVILHGATPTELEPILAVYQCS